MGNAVSKKKIGQYCNDDSVRRMFTEKNYNNENINKNEKFMDADLIVNDNDNFGSIYPFYLPHMDDKIPGNSTIEKFLNNLSTNLDMNICDILVKIDSTRINNEMDNNQENIKKNPLKRNRAFYNLNDIKTYGICPYLTENWQKNAETPNQSMHT